MNTRSQTQKRRAAEELTSASFETPVIENDQVENLIADPCRTPRIQPEILDEINSTLRRAIMSDFANYYTKIKKKC